MRLPNAEMKCAECGEYVEPMTGSSAVVAWYSCPGCEHFWSAILNDGSPVMVDVPQESSLGATSRARRSR
jgi:hypothetical protein